MCNVVLDEVNLQQDPPILIEVTRRPQAFRSTPMLEAVTPLPKPLTTPPVTNTYFISNRVSPISVYWSSSLAGRVRKPNFEGGGEVLA